MSYIDSTPEFSFPIFDGKEFLSKEETLQVAVLFEPLFPANHKNGIPGASDAKAQQFLSQLLALNENEYYKIPIWRTAYREGLILLDQAAHTKFSKELTSLSAEEAHQFVEALESRKLIDLPDDFDQRGFFNMLLEHCLKGCFADPRWGGNTNGIMWKWLGWIQPAEDIQF